MNYIVIAIFVFIVLWGGALIIVGSITLSALMRGSYTDEISQYANSDVHISFESAGPARIVIVTGEQCTASESAGPVRLGVNVSNKNQRQLEG